MTLREMSEEYRVSSRLLSDRLRVLRRQARECKNREERWHLERRIARLTEMLTQTNELAAHTEHYYERSYCGNEKYRL
ncbi:MAG: hypothetical protein J6K84_04270 [Oscillospiraceae bacterium]|nr:hypothetical protein [Oscillospiraceae bacterium]